MYKSFNIEAENDEIIIKNSHGDHAIIPANKRDWIKEKLESGCNDCIDELVASLPKLSNYAADGTVVPDPPEGDTPITVKRRGPLLPYFKLTPENSRFECTDENCSSYTTSVAANLLGVKRDEMAKLLGDPQGREQFGAWHKRSRNKQTGGVDIWDLSQGQMNYDNFQIGDFVSMGHAKGASSKEGRIPGLVNEEVSGSYEDEFTSRPRTTYKTRHSGIIIGHDENGIPIVEHNMGGTVYRNRITEVTGGYVPLSVFRSKAFLQDSPMFADLKARTLDKYESAAEWEAYLANKGPVGNERDYIYTDEKLLGSDIHRDFLMNQQQIGLNYGMKPDEVRSVYQQLVGIGRQESNLDNMYPSDAGDAVKQAVTKNKIVKGIGKLGKYVAGQPEALSNLIEEQVNKAKGKPNRPPEWKVEMEMAKLAASENITEEEALAKINDKYGYDVENEKIDFTPSKGVFKIKDVPENANLYFGISNKNVTDNKGNELIAAFGLYKQNYNKARKLFPNETPEIWNKIAIEAHNAPSKAYNKEYVDFYIKGIDNPDPEKYKSDYFTKVTDYANQTFQAKQQPTE